VVYTTDHKINDTSWRGDIVKARLTSNTVAERLKPEAQVYISGAETMVEQLRTELEKDFGIPQYRLAYDYFDGYSVL
jgi:NAD(P)H-flavin reductase